MKYKNWSLPERIKINENLEWELSDPKNNSPNEPYAVIMQAKYAIDLSEHSQLSVYFNLASDLAAVILKVGNRNRTNYREYYHCINGQVRKQARDIRGNNNCNKHITPFILQFQELYHHLPKQVREIIQPLLKKQSRRIEETILDMYTEFESSLAKPVKKYRA